MYLCVPCRKISNAYICTSVFVFVYSNSLKIFEVQWQQDDGSLSKMNSSENSNSAELQPQTNLRPRIISSTGNRKLKYYTGELSCTWFKQKIALFFGFQRLGYQRYSPNSHHRNHILFFLFFKMTMSSLQMIWVCCPFSHIK